MGNTNLPGIRAIVNRLGTEGPTMSPQRLVNGCLSFWGIMNSPQTRSMLEHLQTGGELRTGTEDFLAVGQTLQRSTQEYLFARRSRS